MNWQGRRIGTDPTQHAKLQEDIAKAIDKDAEGIRVNQQQVNAAGARVGINRPELQYTVDGKRYYIEDDKPLRSDPTRSRRGKEHKDRIEANDPNATVILRTVGESE